MDHHFTTIYQLGCTLKNPWSRFLVLLAASTTLQVRVAGSSDRRFCFYLGHVATWGPETFHGFFHRVKPQFVCSLVLQLHRSSVGPLSIILGSECIFCGRNSSSSYFWTCFDSWILDIFGVFPTSLDFVSHFRRIFGWWIHPGCICNRGQAEAAPGRPRRIFCVVRLLRDGTLRPFRAPGNSVEAKKIPGWWITWKNILW